MSLKDRVRATARTLENALTVPVQTLGLDQGDVIDEKAEDRKARRGAPMIRVQCPVCNATMTAPESEAGRKGACPKCGQRLQIPAGRPPVRNPHHAQVSGTVSQPQPVGAEPSSLPSSRFRPFVLGAVCGLLVGLVIGTTATLTILGARGGQRDDSGRAGAEARKGQDRSPAGKGTGDATTAARPKSAMFTKGEFREKVKTFTFGPNQWAGINGVRALLKKDDFYHAFGEPSQTNTSGRSIYWYWECKDGAVQVVLVQAPLEKGIVLLESINDLR